MSGECMAWNFNSGMGAIDAALSHLVGYQDVSSSRNIYGGAYQLLHDWFGKRSNLDVGVVFFDGFAGRRLHQGPRRMKAKSADRLKAGRKVYVYLEARAIRTACSSTSPASAPPPTPPASRSSATPPSARPPSPPAPAEKSRRAPRLYHPQLHQGPHRSRHDHRRRRHRPQRGHVPPQGRHLAVGQELARRASGTSTTSRARSSTPTRPSRCSPA